MLTPHQLQAILDAAKVISGLAGLHVGSDTSLCVLLRQILGHIEDTSSLGPEERGIIDQLIIRIYPDIDLKRLQPSDPPEHVGVKWVIGYLNMVRSTFYKEVFEQLLWPVNRIGGRPYFLKSEVVELMVRREKGQWTYSKLRKLKEKNAKKAAKK